MSRHRRPQDQLLLAFALASAAWLRASNTDGILLAAADNGAPLTSVVD